MPDRLDDETLANVDKFSLSPPPPIPITDRTHTLQFVRLLSDMPRRQDDEATGKIRAENIVKHLAHLPKPCLDWMLHEAHVRFNFFPTVKELLDLAAKWRRDDAGAQASRLAAQKVEQELQARLHDARKRLRWEECDQEWIDALPIVTKSILAAERLLKRPTGRDGVYVQSNEWRERRDLREQQLAEDSDGLQRGEQPDSELNREIER